MNIFAIGITLLVGLIMVLVISSLVSRSSNPTSYDRQDEGTLREGYIGSSGPAEAQGHDRGDWGGRDMSHDHHSSGHVSDAGTNGDWGGDARGGEGGGGGE